MAPSALASIALLLASAAASQAPVLTSSEVLRAAALSGGTVQPDSYRNVRSSDPEIITAEDKFQSKQWNFWDRFRACHRDLLAPDLGFPDIFQVFLFSKQWNLSNIAYILCWRNPVASLRESSSLIYRWGPDRWSDWGHTAVQWQKHGAAQVLLVGSQTACVEFQRMWLWELSASWRTWETSGRRKEVTGKENSLWRVVGPWASTPPPMAASFLGCAVLILRPLSSGRVCGSLLTGTPLCLLRFRLCSRLLW